MYNQRYMYQKDYILRMIEMLGHLVAGILGLIKKGELPRAEKELAIIYHNMLKEDAAFFRQIPEEELTEKLLHDHNYTNAHLEILAELFNAEAELCLASGDNAGCISYSRKALILFEFIDRDSKTYSEDRLRKISALQSRIGDIKDS